MVNYPNFHEPKFYGAVTRKHTEDSPGAHRIETGAQVHLVFRGVPVIVRVTKVVRPGETFEAVIEDIAFAKTFAEIKIGDEVGFSAKHFGKEYRKS